MVRRVLPLLLLVLLGGIPAHGEDGPRAGPRGHPWVGLDGEDVFAAGSQDPKRLDALEGMGTLLVRTAPIPWGRIVPVAPLGDGRQLHDWEALDRAVIGWQRRGARLVLVLEPRASWAAKTRGPSAFEREIADALGAGGARVAREIGTGLRPPTDWRAWQRFVEAVVERYDKDGKDDAENLVHPLRWIQILDLPSRPGTWAGSPADYARLLHHALLGARDASATVRVAHGGVDLGLVAELDSLALGSLAVSLAKHVRDRSDLDRFLARRQLGFAESSLGLSRVFQAAAVAGASHLDAEGRSLRLLDAFLARARGATLERWLTRTPAAKLAGGTTARERRVRARWAAAARGRSGDRGRARRWLDEGRAYDVARTLVEAAFAGADRVFLGHSVAGGEEGSLGAFVERDGKGGWWRRAPWYALRQALGYLDRPGMLKRIEVAGPCRAVHVRRDGAKAMPWIVILLPDPDRTWAGDPREDVETIDVAVRLEPGTYRVETTATGPEEPASTVHQAPDGVLRLSLGPAPVYVVPVSPR